MSELNRIIEYSLVQRNTYIYIYLYVIFHHTVLYWNPGLPPAQAAPGPADNTPKPQESLFMAYLSLRRFLLHDRI